MIQVNNLNKFCGSGSVDVTEDEVTDYVTAYTNNTIGTDYPISNLSLPLMNAGLNQLQNQLNTSSEPDSIITNIAKLKNKIEMSEQLCNSNLSVVKEVENAYNALGSDVSKFSTVLSKQEQHINKLRGNFKLTRSEKEKEIGINVYYNKLYDAYLNILKTIALFSFFLVVLSLLNRYGIISGNIDLYLSLTIIIICSVIVITQIVDIYSRSPSNFDEYNWTDDTIINKVDDKDPRLPSSSRDNQKGTLLRGRCPTS